MKRKNSVFIKIHINLLYKISRLVNSAPITEESLLYFMNDPDVVEYSSYHHHTQFI